ncbi:hypothetical protein Acr_15g0003820 [Actinidia rufa]|uniref:Uncharacterized protein n=1 Tax=Actinidia rufa TaxID=165716 RepID=A0A7J0FSV7_9ERIC|nr:hypothetical protein Acr_15g0003820 [Actinidia rufa]
MMLPMKYWRSLIGIRRMLMHKIWVFLSLGVEEAEHSISNVPTDDEGNNHSGKKRKSSNESLDAFLKRDHINEELQKLSNLSRIERHRALLAIDRGLEMTACSFTLEDEEKEDFMKALLRGDL